jgi:predicted nucleic acid-binding protein
VTVVVDASVAYKCLLQENDSETALALVRDQLCAAPDFLLLETRNAILTGIRRGKFSEGRAIEIEQELNRLPLALVSTVTLLAQAFAVGLELEHPIYDCLYLATAIQLDATLVTADRRFLAAVGNTVHADRVVALSEFRAE